MFADKAVCLYFILLTCDILGQSITCNFVVYLVSGCTDIQLYHSIDLPCDIPFFQICLMLKTDYVEIVNLESSLSKDNLSILNLS